MTGPLCVPERSFALHRTRACSPAGENRNARRVPAYDTRSGVCDTLGEHAGRIVAELRRLLADNHLLRKVTNAVAQVDVAKLRSSDE